jgi:hypothetical protein
MAMMEQYLGNGRFIGAERVLELLDGQLRIWRQELHQAKNWSSTGQLRNTMLNLRRNRLFMSAICNQQIRPNTKEASRGTSRASR